MPIKILMPALSPTMKSGKLSAWLIKEGDKVLSGDILCEIETDKTTMEVESIDDGIISKILIKAGTENVAVNTIIAILLEENEDLLEENNLQTSTSTSNIIKPNIKTIPIIPIIKSNKLCYSSPLARRIAKLKNIDISLIIGTGPNNRVIKRDVLNFISSNNIIDSKSIKVPINDVSTVNDKDIVKSFYINKNYKEIPIDNIRRIISKRMVDAMHNIPHIFLTIDCNIDKLLNLRKDLNSYNEKKISVNDFIIKAVALTLMKVPEVNSSWTGDSILMHKNADISIAVAIEGGLITPIIVAANQKKLLEISMITKDLVARARDKKLIPNEYQGGTFTISNMGMMGVKQFTSIINFPQSAILSIGAYEKRVSIDDNNKFIIKTVITCTIACDHRIIDGSIGASFLTVFKKFIEQPISILL